ncbi:diamine N-acetyltransferase [Reticulomyxa filosa]|uniref:Diamine N-acetyltransferase n=1 Tax=Reticulomyxa filosa TaxID=46433 RepID=X6N6Y3_RETFI|nr:diamine N-acetyltransferase [Reticulomyxa filosa]|eukprot:ETO21504.1 diamine N-acetyltransferase [Reticulomyxa filosa]
MFKNKIPTYFFEASLSSTRNMPELSWPILVALVLMALSQLFVIYKFTRENGKAAQSKKDQENKVGSKTKEGPYKNCEVKLVPDKDGKTFCEWLIAEKESNALKYLDAHEMYGNPILLEKIQKAPEENYPKRFSGDDEKSMFYFRRGTIQSCDRFNAVGKNNDTNKEFYFGHIECIVVKSPHMEYCNETNKNVGWIFAVYCAPDYRGTGLSVAMIGQSLEYLRRFVKCVYLIVLSENDRGFHCYQKCGFVHLNYVGVNDKYRLMRCLLN